MKPALQALITSAGQCQLVAGEGMPAAVLMLPKALPWASIAPTQRIQIRHKMAPFAYE